MSTSGQLYVVKRNGTHQRVAFDKITSRISKQCYNLSMEYIDPALITVKVMEGLYPGVSTTELDNLAAETAATMTIRHPDYATLAARIAVSNLHKETVKQFSSVIDLIYNAKRPDGSPMAVISKRLHSIVMKHADTLDSALLYDRDYQYNYFGFKTLEKSYLVKINGKVVERPQHMIMRVAVAIHEEDIESALESYNLMSQKYFTHATPTLYHAGTCNPHLSSCFLLTLTDDSTTGIFDVIKKCAIISKSAGGIGLSIHDVRAKSSYISGSNSRSNGIIPMIRVFDSSVRYVDQGGNRRPGAIAMYLEPWHADVFDFIELRKNRGNDEMRARNLFYALWVPDLFMERVENDGNWTLMCPKECPGLSDVWGEEFRKLYEKYESEGKGRETIKAQKLWHSIVECQIESGNPFMVYKDSCNAKSNQQNLGTIKSSNLCTEIVEFCSPSEIAVCNLASIALPQFVNGKKGSKPTFNFDQLVDVTGVLVKNLNRVIDTNQYPLEETQTSNFKHRPIGLGVQGLADTFVLMRLPFESKEASDLNRDIFEAIYFGAMKMSCELAKSLGHYDSFPGSPISKGIFQFDMWNVKPSSRWDWGSLKEDVINYGTRNSLLLAPMPTASTAQILGNNESIDPFTSNVYTRRVISGEFQIVNHHLLKDLVNNNCWNETIKHQLLESEGSIQNIEGIPEDLKKIYKTIWEIPQRVIIDMAADRAAFIDQSQSLNIHMAEPNYAKVSSMHFYAWKKGLKTGMYYLRSRPASEPIKFTVDKTITMKFAQKPCSLTCESCSA
ncbi:hypothetical protein GJ496_002697 [Pomphorhynchus laevis]|nr:hypothetical protein GJ496_002697 [Pomphorhynchus laevis]